MRKTVFLFIVLFFTLFLFSCKTTLNTKNNTGHSVNYIPYYAKVYEADSLFLLNNFEKSYEILDDLFKKYKPINTKNYYEYGVYIASAVMTGRTTDIDSKIKKGVLEYGGIGFFHPKTDSIYDIIYNKTTKITRNEFIKLYELSKVNVDTILAAQIIKMYDEDQSVRLPDLDYNGMNLFEKKHKKIIVNIIEKYGFPSFQMTKTMVNKEGIPVDFVVVFLHQSARLQKKYLNLIYSDMLLGKVSPEEYSFIVDKIYNIRNKKSLYGTIPDFPLLNPEKISLLRKSIGLPVYKYERWRDSILDPEFYKK